MFTVPVSWASGTISLFRHMGNLGKPYRVAIIRNAIFSGILGNTVQAMLVIKTEEVKKLVWKNVLLTIAATLGTNYIINFLAGPETVALWEGLPELAVASIGAFS
ncbi:MAG TPA: hypothetical protein VLE89_05790 [Chlamydiales bacterium]|nr:hypothetical protein [Chlamydiales bacterium]